MHDDSQFWTTSGKPADANNSQSALDSFLSQSPSRMRVHIHFSFIHFSLPTILSATSYPPSATHTYILLASYNHTILNCDRALSTVPLLLHLSLPAQSPTRTAHLSRPCLDRSVARPLWLAEGHCLTCTIKTFLHWMLSGILAKSWPLLSTASSPHLGVIRETSWIKVTSKGIPRKRLTNGNYEGNLIPFLCSTVVALP